MLSKRPFLLGEGGTFAGVFLWRYKVLSGQKMVARAARPYTPTWSIGKRRNETIVA